jgi:hypothetical protein
MLRRLFRRCGDRGLPLQQRKVQVIRRPCVARYCHTRCERTFTHIHRNRLFRFLNDTLGAERPVRVARPVASIQEIHGSASMTAIPAATPTMAPARLGRHRSSLSALSMFPTRTIPSSEKTVRRKQISKGLLITMTLPIFVSRNRMNLRRSRASRVVALRRHALRDHIN